MIKDKIIEKIIYDWIVRFYGKQGAQNPSWNIELLSKELIRKINDK